MKKIIAALLCAAIVLSMGSFTIFAKESATDLGLAVASDLHYNAPREELDGQIDDSIYWYANRRAAMEDESGFIIDAFLAQCANDDSCEYVLIAGDMADNGRSIQADHDTVAQKLRDFEQKTGKQVYVINGNHDASENSETTFADFKRIYHEFGYDEALAFGNDDCSYTADLGEKYRLIALDSCHKTASTEDGMTTEKIEWVHTQAKAAKADGRYPILMMHHNLLDHMPLQRILSRNFIVRYHCATAELFADWGIKLVISGHEHCSDAAVYTSALGNKIYDFATTSLTMYPLTYRMFYFADDKISYESKTVESIDTDALTAAVKGYSQEQIDLMNQDLNAYAKGFLKAGVKYRLELSLSMEKMGISEDDFYYGVVNTAVNGLTDLLNMPLYGENGLQTLAKEYNIVIPDTDYETAWDLATDLVAYHYSGEENYMLDGDEISLFLRTVVLILKTDLPNVCDEVLFKAADKVLGNLGIESFSKELTKCYVERYGAVTAAEYLLMAVVSPFIYEFIKDNDGVNDNNGTIDGYAVGSLNGNIQEIKNHISNFIAKLKLYAQLMMNYFLKAFHKFVP